MTSVADSFGGYLRGHTLGGEVGEHLGRLVETAGEAARAVAEAGGDPCGPLVMVAALLRDTADQIDEQVGLIRASGKAPPP